MSTPKPAILALEDGSIFRGRAFGADATVSGECVFNTSMTGYQEILTDPSYFGQIVTMTAVQIGNYGVNDEDTEASAPKCTGFVVRELSPVVSNWRSQLPLGEYLTKYGIPGISEIASLCGMVSRCRSSRRPPPRRRSAATGPTPSSSPTARATRRRYLIFTTR